MERELVARLRVAGSVAWAILMAGLDLMDWTDPTVGRVLLVTIVPVLVWGGWRWIQDYARRAVRSVLLAIGAVIYLPAASYWVLQAPAGPEQGGDGVLSDSLRRKAKLMEVVRGSDGCGRDPALIDALEALNSDSTALEGLDLGCKNLGGITLSRALLAEAHFDSTVLSEANFHRASLRFADLSNADASRSHYYRAELRFSDLSHGQFIQSNFVAADLVGADLTGSQLLNAKLDTVDLARAKLVGVQLELASLREASLYGADVKNADLTMADLRGADLGGLKNWREIESLVGANIARLERHPEGFVEWATRSGAKEWEFPEEWRAFRDSNSCGIDQNVRRSGRPASRWQLLIHCDVIRNLPRESRNFRRFATEAGCLIPREGEVCNRDSLPQLLRP